MNKKDKVQMEKYDITSSTREVFFYKDFKYDKLDQAVKYAQHEENISTPISPDAASS
jgi:hypothetical protein